MVRKHNRGEWSNQQVEVIRPSNEKIKLEIFSYDHQYTKIFNPSKDKIKGKNNEKINHRSLRCYKSEDGITSQILELQYNVKSVGEYRIDIIYENRNAKDYVGEYSLTLTSKKSSKLYSNTSNVMTYVSKINKLNPKVKKVQAQIKKAKEELQKLTAEDKKKQDANKIKEAKQVIAKYESQLTKTQKNISKIQSQLDKSHKMVGGTELLFDGELNITKRKTVFHQLNELGKYTLAIELPANCYFITAVIRKVLTYTGDNLDSAETNLMFQKGTISKSGQIKPAEASFEIGYDTRFESDLTSTGFYFDYVDEVNIYVKEDNDASNKEMVRRFGGYLSTISHDNDRKKITMSCADRLIDGESKYILDSLLIQKGTTSESEMEYNKPINFNNYGQALKYLCDIHETTLKSNIKKNYLVEGEKYSTGLAIRFGKKKDIKNKKQFNPKNCSVKINKNFVTIRNGQSGTKKQSIVLYNGKEHSKAKPIALKRVVKNKVQENHLTLHLTYGLGDPAKQSKISSVDQTSNADGTTGNYGKCGQSADKKTVMSIAKPSSGRFEGLNGDTWYKVVFKNWCPHCKKSNLVYDSGTEKTNCVTCSYYTGSKRTWGDISEGEITCNTEDCCADYCGATGWEKDGNFASRLVTVVKPVKSSKAEQNKLLNGEMSGAGAIKVSAENIFKEITKEAFKYRYKLRGETYQTYADMKKHGMGDCWAFSDLIFTMMKKFGVKCKIVEYVTDQSDAHRSVRYMAKNGKWADFPYREYGWSEKYDHNLNNTPRSATAHWVKINNAGKSIDKASGTISSTSTTTTTTTITKGYDKDKPYQAYIEMTYSTEQKWKAKKKKVNINFTQKAGTNNDIAGLPSYWINNAQRQVSIDMKGWFEDNEPNKSIYLHTIRFVTPEIVPSKDDKNRDWYTYDKSTHDEASCKIDLYQLIFDDRKEINPTDLQSCGKTVNSMMEEIVNASGYRVHMKYGRHRCDDRIIFSIDNQTKANFIAQEGDNNNILEWSNISCSPVTVLRNTTIFVYKDGNKYKYVDSRDLKTLALYGEQATLETNSEISGSKQAYFLARNSKDYNPEFDYTYTIVVPYAPNLQLGDYVQVISNRQYLNDVKPIESLQLQYDTSTKPILQTTLGLGEIEPYLRIKDEMQKLRTTTKKSTSFSTSATPDDDDEIYIWEQ